MKEDSPEAKAGRLLQLSEEVGKIAGSLARLSIGIGAPLGQHYPCSNLNAPDVLLGRVSWLIRTRRERARYLPTDLFSDPPWDILLELLRAELARERISVASACTAAGIMPSTGLRWLKVLEQRRLVLRQGDARDEMRAFVVLSSDASNALRRYFIEIVGKVRSHGR